MSARSAESVELSCGRVRGRDHAWLGIPYAAPPVGPLRWAPPAPVEPWAGELDALRVGPPPPQPVTPITAFAWGDVPPGDEDCLYLNVWRPRTGDGPWPVLVWLIGGGWRVGWTGSGAEHGARLADAAQVVVVNGCYRLGSLGWAYGNWGMLDQQAMLEWVQREIGAFGGDPGAVTLGGQSAGAGSVAGHLVSGGPFERAILHSPPLPEAAQPLERRIEWERSLGRPDDVVARHEALLREPAWAGTRGGALPTLDHPLPVHPLDVPGASPDVPVLAGYTRDEATFLFRTGGREAPDEQVSRVTRSLFQEPTDRWIAARRQAGGEVNAFRVDFPSPDPRLGALHTIDVPLLFGTLDNAVSRHYVDDDERTRSVSAWVQREWGRFLRGESLAWPSLQVVG